MRRAKPEELRTRAVPAITARISAAELEEWLPVSFDDISDPLAVPEPSKGALVQFAGGSYGVVYYGLDSGQLIVEVPESANASVLVAEFFDEVPLPVSRVLWHRADVVLPATEKRNADRAKRSARSVSLPKKRR